MSAEKKYYRAENAGRAYAGIYFLVYGIVAGSAVGIYATEDPEEIKKLDALVGKSPVTSISESEYDEYLKKKLPSSDLTQSNPRSVPTEKRALKGTGDVQVAEHPEAEEKPIEVVAEVESPEAALTVGQPPDSAPAPAPVAPTPRRGRRAQPEPSVT